jgi:hypothetical protein
MKTLLPLVAIFSAVSALAGTISCAPDTAANYIANGSCTEAPFILKNFTWNSFSGGSFVKVTPGQVFLTPTSSAGAFGLSFQGVPGNPNPFNISGNQEIFASFDYTIDPRPPILNGMTVTLNANSPSGGGFAKITTLVCVGDTFADSCAKGTDLAPIVVQDFGHGDPRNVLSVNVDFPSVNIVDIQMILDMEANGGISEITGGGTAAQSSNTPEPASAGFALTGLAAMLVVVRRRRQA